MFIEALFIKPKTKNISDIQRWVSKQTGYSYGIFDNIQQYKQNTLSIHAKPTRVSRELSWVKKPKICILYDSICRTFLRWQNYTNGEESDDCQE